MYMLKQNFSFAILLSCLLPRVIWGRKCFICVTGQLSRYEYDNKNKHLYTPLRRICDEDFDVANVLAPTTFLHGGVSEVSPTSNVSHTPPTMLPLPHILDWHNFTWKPWPSKLQRDNWRMFNTIASCADVMPNKSYDVVVRVREDLLFHSHQGLDVDAVVANIQPHTVLIQNHEHWGGMNDKIAVMDGVTASTYFSAGVNYWLENRTYYPRCVFNAETFYYMALQERHVRVAPLDALGFSEGLRFFKHPHKDWGTHYPKCTHFGRSHTHKDAIPKRAENAFMHPRVGCVISRWVFQGDSECYRAFRRMRWEHVHHNALTRASELSTNDTLYVPFDHMNDFVKDILPFFDHRHCLNHW